MGKAQFTPNQLAYRFRNDDGDEAGATWMAAENTAASVIANSASFRLRILVQETSGGGSNNVDHALQFSRNGGDWINVTSSTNFMRLAPATGHLAAGTATTKQLAAGSGAFRPGEVNDASDYDSRTSYSGNDHSEHEWVLQALATGDYEFRVTLNDEAISITQMPTLTATPPPAPTEAPVVSVDSFTHDSVSFSWTPVENAASYAVDKHNGVDWGNLGSTAGLSHVDTNVQPETTYMYRVRGISAGGVGPLSNEITVTTDEAPPPPTEAPVLGVDNITPTSFRLFWNEVPDADEYSIEVDFGDGNFIDVVTTANTEQLMGGVEEGVTYRARVRGINDAGSGPVSNIVEATPAAPNPNFFTHLPTGEFPEGWTELWADDATSVVANDGTAPNGGVSMQRTTSGSTGRRCFAWTEAGQHSDIYTQVNVNMAVVGTNDARLVIRGGGSAGAETGYILEMFWNSGSPELLIRRYNNGGNAVLARTPFSYTSGIWYTMYFSMLGNQMAGMAWPTGTPRPSSWMVFTSDSTIPGPGYVGVGEWGTNRTFSYDAITWAPDHNSLQSIQPPISEPPQAAPTLNVDHEGVSQVGLFWSLVIGSSWYEVERDGEIIHLTVDNSFEDDGLAPETSYNYRVRAVNDHGAGPWSNEVTATTFAMVTHRFTDFSEYTTGQFPDDWSERWRVHGDWTIIDDAGAEGGKMLRSVNTTGARDAFAWLGAGVHTDTQVIIRTRSSGAPGSTADRSGAAVRISGGQGFETGVVAFIHGDGNLRMRQYNNGSLSNISTVPVNLIQNEIYYIKLEAVDNIVRAKIWHEDDPEPAGWTATGTTSVVDPGPAGVFTFGNNDLWDSVDVLSLDEPDEEITDAPVLSLDNMVSDEVWLSWTEVDGVYQYEVQRDAESIATLYDTELSNFVEPETTYAYRVRGINNSFQGPWSNELVVTTPELPPELTEALFTFGDREPGEQPDRWRELWVQTARSEILYTADATDQRIHRRMGFDSNARIAAIIRDSVETMDFDARMRFRIQRIVNNDVRLWVRASGEEGSELGIGCEFYHNSSDGSKIFRFIRYGPNGLGTPEGISYDYQPYVWYQFRLRIDGHTMRAKAWEEGEVEPDWMMEFTPASNRVETPGRVGVGGWPTFNFLDIDSFSFASGGADSEPLPPIPVPPPTEVLSPTNLIATQDGNDVVLSWDEQSSNTSYNVYRDDALIDTVTGDTYRDTSPGTGSFNYRIEAFRTTT